ncbi:MAG: hypothetical protein LPK03_04030 [Pontibacter sp.]|nr:hypothetical protein [Pontibacter sp.]
MKPEKPIEEAILRAHNATEKEHQSQDQLYNMRTPQTNTPSPSYHGEAPLNESHINLMQSWQNLRGLDNKLAQTKYSDMKEAPKSTRTTHRP